MCIYIYIYILVKRRAVSGQGSFSNIPTLERAEERKSQPPEPRTLQHVI
jgi:hypothetical protein